MTTEPISRQAAAAALDKAVRQVRLNLPLYTDRCQNHSSVRGVYPACDNVQWTCGFWPDGSTYHTFFMDPDGTPGHGATCQGYRDDSFWARGQAWGVYGSILSYRYTKKAEYLGTFRKALAFYLTRLPADLVPYWDMVFTDGCAEPRDSSSAAIVACGLLEACKWVDEAEAAGYETLARRMLASLAQNYTAAAPQPGAGQILHGTYSKKSPYNTCTPEGVDEYTSWGDYFYMEALTRLTKGWQLYW